MRKNSQTVQQPTAKDFTAYQTKDLTKTGHGGDTTKRGTVQS